MPPIGVYRNVSAKDVADFHRQSDVDQRRESLHHTVGRGANQVAGGGHTHNGSDSVSLLDGIIFTGSRGTLPGLSNVVAQALAALELLGANDATTP